jgi:hypothetical protein
MFTFVFSVNTAPTKRGNDTVAMPFGPIAAGSPDSIIGVGEVVIGPALGVNIDLYAKSYLQTWLQGLPLSAAYVRPLKLGGLGSSAGLFNSVPYNYCTLYFTAGTYAILLSTNAALASKPALGVTKQQIEGLAHAHLS